MYFKLIENAFTQLTYDISWYIISQVIYLLPGIYFYTRYIENCKNKCVNNFKKAAHAGVAIRLATHGRKTDIWINMRSSIFDTINHKQSKYCYKLDTIYVINYILITISSLIFLKKLCFVNYFYFELNICFVIINTLIVKLISLPTILI